MALKGAHLHLRADYRESVDLFCLLLRNMHEFTLATAP